MFFLRRDYSRLNITFNATNLPNLSPGVTTITLYAQGYNRTNGIIVHSENRTLLSEQVNISLTCYGTADGVYVTACGSLDPDQPSTSPSSGSTTGAGGGSGGGGVASTEFVKSSEALQLVRGEENDIVISFLNKDKNFSLTDIKFKVTGKIAKYIKVIPAEYSSLGPGQKMEITLKIISPTYIEIGKQEITLFITGIKGNKAYSESKQITLEIHELSGEEAQKLLDESFDFIKRFIDAGFSMGELEILLNESVEAMEIFDYEKIRDNHGIIKKTVESAVEAKQIIDELNELVRAAAEKEIDVSNTVRVINLAVLSLERGDYEQALERAKEAQVTYALEVKGEFGSVLYFVKSNPKEISFAIVLLALLSFVSYKAGHLQVIRKRIKDLQLEERILHELMAVVQKEAFKEKKMSMEEYQTAMLHYEKRLSEIIEKLIEAETKRAYALKFSTKQKRLKNERDRVIGLIKDIQKKYLKEGKMETKSYELRLESYNRRLGEIDKTVATLEAKSAIKRNKRTLNIFSGGMK